MSKDILDMFGGNSIPKQPGQASSGGIKEAKPIANYSTPVGPKGIGDAKSPGLHGDNHGNCGTQGKR